MLVEEAVTRVRGAGRGNQNVWSVDRIIDFLNTSLQQVSSMLIANKYAQIVKTVQLHDGDTLPDNFMIAAGSYPIRITEGTVEILDENLSEVRFRYFASVGRIVKTSDTMPFTNDAINEVIVKGAILLALNENSYQIGQDSQLVAALQQAVAAGLGGNVTNQ